MRTITIKDETTAGNILNQIALEFEQEYITVEQLIATRVKTEIEKSKTDITNYKRGLVLPTDLENRINNKKHTEIDVEKQVYVAYDGFMKNKYFILVDDEQVSELNQKILITESTMVSFIKLTPLVGG